MKNDLSCQITNSLSLIDNINNGNGYEINIKLNPDELALVRQLVQIHWLYRIQLLANQQVKFFYEKGLEKYHEVSHLIDHQSAWHTITRVLSVDAVNQIKKLPFFLKLNQILGEIQIADEENLGWENMLWRLVRPGNTDCGPIHADRWFFETGQFNHIESYPFQRLNVWIALFTSVGENGLWIIPESHKRKWKWHVETRDGKKKPHLDEDLTSIEKKLLLLESGEGVIFSHDLLHGGAPNHASTTRVSLEFTILLPLERDH